MSKWMILAALLLFSASNVLAEDFPLSARSLERMQAMNQPGVVGAYAPWMTDKPSELKQEPKAIASYPLYGMCVPPASVASGQRILARLDKSSSGAAYDRLILDLNYNGDLTDDPVLEAQDAQNMGGNYEMAFYGPAEITLPEDQGGIKLSVAGQSYVFNTELIGKRKTSFGQLMLHPATLLEADIVLDGVKERVALVDGDCDLKLGEAARCVVAADLGVGYWGFYDGDVLMRDRNGSGSFENDPANSESEPLGEIVYFGGKPYAMRVAADLSSLSVEPYGGNVVETKLPAGGAIQSLTLGRKVADNQYEAFTLSPQGETVALPEGVYGLYSVVMQASSGTDRWLTMGMKRQPGAFVEVVAGGSPELKAGSPLKVKLVAEPQYGDGGSGGGLLGALAGALKSAVGASTVEINAEVFGAGGEQYMTYVRNGQTVNPPKFQILDENGKELASGQLEYG